MRKRSWVFLVATFSLFFFFYIFSRQVKLEQFKQINFDITVRLQDKIPERFGEVFEDAGILITPVPSVILVLLISFYGFIIRKGWKKKAVVAVIPLAFALLVGAEVYGKMKVESPAPPFFMLKNPTTIFPTYHVQEQYSYPSGHAARSTFVAVILWYLVWSERRTRRFHIIVAGATGLYVLFISVGKIYLGHHWVSDIGGGLIIGAAFGLLVVLALDYTFKQVAQTKRLEFSRVVKKKNSKNTSQAVEEGD